MRRPRWASAGRGRPSRTTPPVTGRWQAWIALRRQGQGPLFLLVVWPFPPRLLAHFRRHRAVLGLQFFDQLAEHVVPDLALDGLAHVPAEAAGTRPGPHGLG